MGELIYLDVFRASRKRGGQRKELRDTSVNSTLLSLDDVQRAVAGFLGVEPHELLGKSRQHPVAQPGRIAMYVCSRHLGASLQVIGKHFNQSPTVVVSAVRSIEAVIRKDLSVRKAVDAVKLLLGLKEG